MRNSAQTSRYNGHGRIIVEKSVLLLPTVPAIDENDLPERDSASPGRKKRRRARKPPAYKVRFGNVSPEEAAQGRKITSERVKSTLSSRRLASDIQTKELWLTGAQKEALDALCLANEIVDHAFYINHENARQL
jgi:hypothetical protein